MVRPAAPPLATVGGVSFYAFLFNQDPLVSVTVWSPRPMRCYARQQARRWGVRSAVSEKNAFPDIRETNTRARDTVARRRILSRQKVETLATLLGCQQALGNLVSYGGACGIRQSR